MLLLISIAQNNIFPLLYSLTWISNSNKEKLALAGLAGSRLIAAAAQLNTKLATAASEQTRNSTQGPKKRHKFSSPQEKFRKEDTRHFLYL